MEQIYYTQCPIGYGLGASNGFQIKRIGAGYPPSGDVRHLALRAFLPGSSGKVLAPGTLRYRRLGTVAEVAWLEPRAREYETERGQWGRPGGHFAHGLRLEPEELTTLSHWPAGLFGRPFWRRADPEPSRGRRPEALAIGADDLRSPAVIEHVAPEIDLDAETLARLLAAVADAVRTGRTLFLIDEPERLGPRIAALTFAFPAVLRPELTFSTYHDRPEELSGFRINGTVPSPLINRPVLAGLGPIADLGAGRFDPSPPPPSWARSLASWLTRREARDADDWSRTDDRARMARRPDDHETRWSDSWLDGLFGMAEASRLPAPAPSTDADWSQLARQSAWASASGLSEELVRSRGPGWWRPLLRDAVRSKSAHEAFWDLVLDPSTWANGAETDASAWGEVASPFWSRYRSPRREQALNAALRRITPADRLARFLDGLIRSVPAESGRSALEWLERRDEVDPRVLLPLRARVAVTLLRSEGREDALEDILDGAARLRDSLPTVLDLIADQAGDDPDAGPIAAAVSRIMANADLDVRLSHETWALRRSQAGDDRWIAPEILRLFATDHDRSDWDALRDRTPSELWAALARVCLEVAEGADLSSESFPWSIEHLLLRIPEGGRPLSSSWVETYVRRVGSPFSIADRMRTRDIGVRSWLEAARGEGELSLAVVELLDDADVLSLLLDGKGELPGTAMLTRLPPEDRGAVLGLLLDRLADGQFEASEPILAQCSRSWPGAFDTQAEGSDRLAVPLADLLLQFVPDPVLWIGALGRLRAWLGLDRMGEATWPSTGIAGRIIAETCRLSADPTAAWELRSALLRDDAAYRSLCEDASRDLRSQHVRSSGEVARRWDLSLDKGTHTDRFFEVILNACDGPRLAVVVPEFIGELGTLGSLPWWHGDRPIDGPSDLREAFATLAPMAPLDAPRTAAAIESWLLRREPITLFSTIRDDPDVLPVLEDGRSPPDSSEAEQAIRLSGRALGRWACIRALTEFYWEGKTDEARWSDLARWRSPADGGNPPPISSLELPDRYDFLGWLIVALDHPGADSFKVEELARWVVKILGLHSRSRLTSSLEAIGATGVQLRADRRRLARDLGHEMTLQLDG